MSKSALYAYNKNQQAVVATGTIIDFGSIVRRFGNNCNLKDGNAICNGSGYYSVDVNLTFVSGSSASGVVKVSLFRDGIAIPGAVSQTTVAAAGTVSVTIPAMVRQNCCYQSNITAIVSDLAGNVTNAAIRMEKE